MWFLDLLLVQWCINLTHAPTDGLRELSKSIWMTRIQGTSYTIPGKSKKCASFLSSMLVHPWRIMWSVWMQSPCLVACTMVYQPHPCINIWIERDVKYMATHPWPRAQHITHPASLGIVWWFTCRSCKILAHFHWMVYDAPWAPTIHTGVDITLNSSLGGWVRLVYHRKLQPSIKVLTPLSIHQYVHMWGWYTIT